MRPALRGLPITAREIESLDRDTFERLCRAILADAASRTFGPFTLPRTTDRTHHADGGLDAELHFRVDLTPPRAPGPLLGPGLNAYQFKYSAYDVDFRRALDRIAKTLRGSESGSRPHPALLRQIVCTCGARPDRFVLFLNRDLRAPRNGNGSRSTPGRILLDALLEGDPGFDEHSIEILGAAQLADAVNGAPHLRAAFFGTDSLLTWEAALEDHVRVSHAGGEVPQLVGRKETVLAVRGFAEGTGAAVLRIFGPPYAGKSRVALEGLRDFSGRVVWATDPGSLEGSTLRLLDSNVENPPLLVIDRCDGAELDVSLDRCLALGNVRSILIGERPAERPRVEDVGVFRLKEGDSLSLIQAVAPRIPHTLALWLLDRAGGLPGILVLARHLGPEPATELRKAEEELYRRVLDGLSADAREALPVYAVLSQVRVSSQPGDEFDALCRSLGRDPARVRAAEPELAARGWLASRGRFRIVSPDLVAEVAAAEALGGQDADGILRILKTSILPGAVPRFLQRLASLAVDYEGPRRAVRNLLDPNGMFSNIERLTTRSREFLALAPADPARAAQRLANLLEGLDRTERAGIEGGSRRNLVWSLEELVFHRDAFPHAARALLLLAEAESETCTNNASGCFARAFDPLHPQVTASLAERLSVLRTLASQNAASDSGTLILSALAAALGTDRHSFALTHVRSPRPPVPAPVTWEEIEDYLTGALDLLLPWIDDPDPAIASSARHVAVDALVPLLDAGVLSRSFDRLEPVLSTITEPAARGELRGKLAFLRDERIRHRLDHPTTPPRRGIDEYPALLERIDSIFARLQPDGPVESLKFWLSKECRGEEWEGFKKAFAETIPALAADAIQAASGGEPWLTPPLLDWIQNQERIAATRFAAELGKRDATRHFEPEFLRISESKAGALLLAAYVSGIGERSLDEATVIADRMARDPRGAEPALRITLWLKEGDRGLERILGLLRDGRLTPDSVADGIDHARWAQDLADESFDTLARQLLERSAADERLRVSTVLLQHLQWRQNDSGTRLEALARDVLSTPGLFRAEGHAAWLIDQIAGRLASKHPAGGAEWIRCGLLSNDPDPWYRDESEYRRLFEAVLQAPAIRQQLVRDALAEVCGNNPRSRNAADLLDRILDLKEDWCVLLDWVDRTGQDAAFRVASLLTYGRDFWRRAAELILRWPIVEAELMCVAGSTRFPVTGKGALERLLQGRAADCRAELANHPSPKVRAFAERAATDLERSADRDSIRDREWLLWDRDLDVEKIRQILSDRESLVRPGLVRRLLERPSERLLPLFGDRLLTRTDVDSNRETLGPAASIYEKILDAVSGDAT